MKTDASTEIGRNLGGSGKAITLNGRAALLHLQAIGIANYTFYSIALKI